MIAGGQDLLYGHLLLFVCSFFYTTWWSRAFRPQNAVNNWETWTFLVITMISGLAAIVFLLMGTLFTEQKDVIPYVTAIFGGGTILYLALLFITSKHYGRPPTSELLFIVLWLTLELASLVVLQSMGLSHNISIISCVVAILIFVINMACYMAYYKLSESIGFLIGMVPLGLAGISSVALSLIIMTELH